MNKELPSMVEELSKILSQINGVTGISETFSLNYVVSVDSEESKKNVEKVQEALTTQAKNFGFDLEIVAATEEELAEVKKKYEEYQNSIKPSVNFSA